MDFLTQWPFGPLLDFGLAQQTEVAYRVVATRGERRRQLGMADAAHVDGFLAAERAALHGWRVEAMPEPFTCWITPSEHGPTGGRGLPEEG